MGVYIKDMEMPTSCNACELAALVDISDGIAYGCRALKEMIYNDRERLPNCPLVPIPPHGRLIDADALDDAFTELRWDSEGLAHWGDRNEWCLSGNEVEELFNNAPTVIPADEDGET